MRATAEAEDPVMAEPRPLARVVQARRNVVRARADARTQIAAAEEEFRQSIRDARDAGYSLDRIGQALGVTRQRVAQILRGE